MSIIIIIIKVKAQEACSGLGQCVEHAECNSPSGGVCLCDEGYFHADGECLTQTEAGNPCTGEEECTPNSVCADTCRCREGYYKVT